MLDNSHADKGAQGSYRWVALLLCSIAFTMTSVDRATWGPSALLVGRDLGVPLASLGIFATCYYVGYVISNLMSGFFTDRLGGRVVIAVSLIGAGSFMIAFGSTPSIAFGIAIQAVVGLFAGAEYAAGIKIISSWFQPKDLGKAMGIYTASTSLGVVIANTTVPHLAARFDWGASYHVFGAISAVIGVACYLLLKPGPVVTIATNDKALQRSVILSLLANRNLVLLALAGFGGFWGTYGFIVWSNALMIEGHAIPPATAGAVVAVFAALGVLGKPIIGFVSDRLNGARRVPAMVGLACFAAMLMVFGSLSDATAFLLAAPVLGLAANSYLPMIVALVPRLVSTQNLGASAGATNALWQLGTMLVPVTVGGSFAASGNSFVVAFATMAAGPMLGIVALYFLDERPKEVRVDIVSRPS